MTRVPTTARTDSTPNASPATPPADDGAPLATLARGADTELRVRWREYKLSFFCDLRVWQKNAQTGDWWPTKKGVSVKSRELAAVIQALEEARRLS
jgi:hypothetical protein